MSVEKWDQRQLCPDGGCIGVIGDSGTCSVCGRAAPNWGEERKRGLRDESGPVVVPETPRDPIEPGAPAAIGKAVGWTERQLCSDGACIGLIGADGKCKVCGLAADGSAPEADEDEDDEYEDDEYEDDDEADDAGDVAAFQEEDEDEDAAAHEAELEAAADDLAASLPAVAEAEAEVDRKLCPDGGCIGVIGADGKCKVCGKEAE